MNRNAVTSGVVCDGFERWEAGVRATLRAEVSAGFAERLRSATMFERFRLRLEIAREVRLRMKDVKPPSDEALF